MPNFKCYQAYQRADGDELPFDSLEMINSVGRHHFPYSKCRLDLPLEDHIFETLFIFYIVINFVFV